MLDQVVRIGMTQYFTCSNKILLNRCRRAVLIAQLVNEVSNLVVADL